MNILNIRFYLNLYFQRWNMRTTAWAWPSNCVYSLLIFADNVMHCKPWTGPQGTKRPGYFFGRWWLWCLLTVTLLSLYNLWTFLWSSVDLGTFLRGPQDSTVMESAVEGAGWNTAAFRYGICSLRLEFTIMFMYGVNWSAWSCICETTIWVF